MPDLDPAISESHVLAIAPFDKWTYEDAHKALQDLLPTDFTTIQKYAVDHDHFQDGAEWVGPGDATINEKIKKQFAPEDAIGEVLSNIENAFGEPQLGTAPLLETADTDAKQAEIRGIISDWWDKQRLQEHIQERQRTSAWAGWADLRLWIPWRFLRVDGAGNVSVSSATTVAEALSFIHVMAPTPDHGAVVFDQGTQDKIGIFVDEEVVYEDDKIVKYPRAELVYLDPARISDKDADTIIRIVYANNDRPQRIVRLPLNGRMTVTEMQTRVVITEPVLRTQRQLNLLTTLITRIGETAAFRERYTKNAKPQGIRIPYADGDTLATGAFVERDDEGRQWAVIPQARTLGAATTTELVGLPKFDQVGDQRGFETPDITIVDPVDPSPYMLAADGVRRRILRMCGQGHLGGASNAEASGIAYEQARAVFEKDLNKRRVSEEGMLRELITTAVAFAEFLSGNVGEYTETLRMTVDQHINPGPRSPDLIRLDIEALEAGALSPETAMSRMGVEDTEAELERLQSSPSFILNMLAKASETSVTFTPESIIDALRELGLPDAVIDKLDGKEEPEPAEAAPAGGLFGSLPV